MPGVVLPDKGSEGQLQWHTTTAWPQPTTASAYNRFDVLAETTCNVVDWLQLGSNGSPALMASSTAGPVVPCMLLLLLLDATTLPAGPTMRSSCPRHGHRPSNRRHHQGWPLASHEAAARPTPQRVELPRQRRDPLLRSRQCVGGGLHPKKAMR